MAKKDLTLFFIWCWFRLPSVRDAFRRARRQSYAAAYRKGYANQYPGRANQLRRARYAEVKENRLAMNQIWRKANAKVVAEGERRWKQENKDKVLAWYRSRSAQKQAGDLGWRIKRSAAKRIWDAVRGISKKDARTLLLLGCTVEELKAHLQNQFLPGMSWDNYGQWHIDHIRPCASFDLTDPEQQRQCFNFKNLQPLWAKDNLSKGAKYNASESRD